MDTKTKERNLKSVFAEIIRGCSSFFFNDKVCYIKHFNYLESCLVDVKRQEYLDYFISKGAITYQERFDHIIKKGFWDENKDKRIKEITDFLANLKHTRSKYTTKRDIILVDKEIDKYDSELFALTREKEKLIGKTAENYADKKSNEFHIFCSLFADEDLKNKLYNNISFEELDDYELNELVQIYNNKMGDFNERNLKKISLMPQFMNLLMLAEDNISSLFGRPLIELTFYQIGLIQEGRVYKNMLQNSKTQPPVEIMGDPVKLSDWFEKNKNLENVIGDTAVQEEKGRKILSAAKSPVGMTKKELKEMGVDTSHQDKIEKALKESKSGELNMTQILKISS